MAQHVARDAPLAPPLLLLPAQGGGAAQQRCRAGGPADRGGLKSEGQTAWLTHWCSLCAPMVCSGSPGVLSMQSGRAQHAKQAAALTGVAVRPRGALPLPLPVVLVALGGHRHLVGHQESRVEAHAKLQHKRAGRGGHRAEFRALRNSAGGGDGPSRDSRVAAHAAAVLGPHACGNPQSQRPRQALHAARRARCQARTSKSRGQGAPRGLNPLPRGGAPPGR